MKVEKGIGGAQEDKDRGSSSLMMPPPKDLRTIRISKALQAHGHGKKEALKATEQAAHRPPTLPQSLPREVKRKEEVRANQAGTKGWRAPEVLMQVTSGRCALQEILFLSHAA